MDYFLPTAVETPKWETDYTVTPSPHHPLGAKGGGRVATRGQHSDVYQRHGRCLCPPGVTHFNMPHTAYRVWQQLKAVGIAS